MNPHRLLPIVGVSALTAWLSALAIRLPPQDGDLLWQRWLGERILREHVIPRVLGPEAFAASGAPWTPQEWLFSIALAWTGDRGATWLVPLACAMAAGLALAMVAVRARRRGVDALLSTAAVLVCALAMLQSFGARAQVVGWAGLASVLWLLELDGPLSWLAVPVTVVWANLHASVFLAPFLALVLAIANVAREQKLSRSAIRLFAIATACGVATLATPLGVDLPRYALGLLTSPIRHSISEWGPTSVQSAAFVAGALPLLLVLAAFGGRASLQDRVVCGVFIVILLTAIRNVPLFALVTAPIAVATLPSRRDRPATTMPFSRLGAWSALTAVMLGGVLMTVLAWQRAPALADALPYAPARALLRATTTPPRIFCEDFAWCSLFLGAPGAATVFMDGRSDPYPPQIWREYRDVIDGKHDWASILDRRRIDTILVRRDSALDSLLADEGSWRPISADHGARLYVRKNLTLCPRPDNAQTTGRSASIKVNGRPQAE